MGKMIMTILNEIERRVRRSQIYNEINAPRRLAWHNRRYDTFTVNDETMTRARFIARYGQPGAIMDVIAWDY